MAIRIIKNSELTLKDLPDPSDRAAVLQFAASFNGYTHFGSSKECAEQANAQKRDSLTALRNELFFWYRASNHQGNDGYVDHYAELLPLFEEFLASGNDK